MKKVLEINGAEKMLETELKKFDEQEFIKKEKERIRNANTINEVYTFLK